MTTIEEAKSNAQQKLEKGLETINDGVLLIYSAKVVLGEKMPNSIVVTFPNYPSLNETNIDLVEDL